MITYILHCFDGDTDELFIIDNFPTLEEAQEEMTNQVQQLAKEEDLQEIFNKQYTDDNAFIIDGQAESGYMVHFKITKLTI